MHEYKYVWHKEGSKYKYFQQNKISSVLLDTPTIRCASSMHAELLEFQTLYILTLPTWSHVGTSLLIFSIRMSLTHIFLTKIHKISPLGVNYWQDGQHFLAHLPKWSYFDAESVTNSIQNWSIMKIMMHHCMLNRGQYSYILWPNDWSVCHWL